FRGGAPGFADRRCPDGREDAPSAHLRGRGDLRGRPLALPALRVAAGGRSPRGEPAPRLRVRGIPERPRALRGRPGPPATPAPRPDRRDRPPRGSLPPVPTGAA